MNAKILLATLFLTLPVLAQDTPPPPVSVDQDQLEDCANVSINYALFVNVAFHSKNKTEFLKFVERQIQDQRDPSLAHTIRKLGEEAWEERNLPPSIAGLDVFKQCEQHLLGITPNVRRNSSQSWDQENLKRNDHGCPTAVFIAPDGNLVQCPPQ
jgi:hypothetical protein